MLDDELLLIEALREGDGDAFERLFRRHYPMLCALARRLLSPEEAEGTAQEVMLWLWENREVVVVETSLAQYLARMTWRRALNRRARQQVKSRVESDFYVRTHADLLDSDFTQFEELRKHISTAVASLPDAYRTAFTMHRHDGMGYKQIAASLGVSPQTVAYRIQQALRLLRVALRDYLPQ